MTSFAKAEREMKLAQKHGIDPTIWTHTVGSARRGEQIPVSLVAWAATFCRETLEARLEPRLYAPYNPDNAKLEDPPGSLKQAEEWAVECYGDSAKNVVRNALVKWATLQKQTVLALTGLADWDHKLSVWCACAVIEYSMRRVPAEYIENFVPFIAATRSWSAGAISTDRLTAVFKKSDEPAGAWVTSDAFEYSSPTSQAILALGDLHRLAMLSGFEQAQMIARVYEGARSAAKLAPLVAARTFRPIISEAIRSYPTSDLVASSAGTPGRSVLAAGIVGVALGAGAMHVMRKL